MKDLALLPWVNLNVALAQGNINYNMEDDLGMFLASCKYTPAETKTEYVSVPGRTGDLDFTEALSGGIVHYGNSQLDMVFKVRDMRNFQHAFLIADFHGKRGEATFSDGLLAGRRFVGRLSVEGIESSKFSGFINISMNVASVEAL